MFLRNVVTTMLCLAVAGFVAYFYADLAFVFVHVTLVLRDPTHAYTHAQCSHTRTLRHITEIQQCNDKTGVHVLTGNILKVARR